MGAFVYLVDSQKGGRQMDSRKKYRRTLIMSIIPMAFTLLLLGTATFAWLAYNKQTTSNGMHVRVEATPNMIINESASAITAVTSPTDSDFSVTFSAAAAAKKPAQHDPADTANKAGDWTYSSGLKYVTNTDNVGVASGLAKTGTLSFATASTTAYYVDFTVYIASTGAALTGQDVVATLTGSIAGSGANKADTLAASSIDFYLGSVAKANYKGTLNQAGLDALTNDHSTTNTSVTILSNGDVPLNSSGYLTVVMRCYIDGGLLKTASQAYINTATVDMNDITLNVAFTASDH